MILDIFMDDKSELVQKPQVINGRIRNEIDHRTSPHVSGLQTSRYIMINHGKMQEMDRVRSAMDKNISNPKQKEYTIKKFEANKVGIKLPVEPITRENLEIKFCKEDDVIRKRHKYILFKTTFAEKIRHLSLRGKRLDIVFRVHDWIEENFEDLYEQLHEVIQYKSIESSKEKAKTMISLKCNMKMSKKEAELHYDKMLFREAIFNLAESLVDKRYQKRRNASLESSK